MIIIGAVKIDVLKSERPFELISFSDVECVKALIKHRSTLDEFYGANHGTVSTVTSHYDKAGIIGGVNAEIIATYVTLDEYLSRCELNWKQKYIIDHIMSGYTECDLSKFFKTDFNNICSVLDTVANRIKVINDLSFKYNFIYMNIKKVDFEHKKCSKCDELLPANRDYFGRDVRNADKLKNWCKKCDRRKVANIVENDQPDKKIQ